MFHLGKRIDPTPPAPADLTDDPAGGVFGLRPRGKIRRHRGFGRWRNRRRRQIHIGGSTQGRLICHASFQALAILALALTMIEAPLQAETLVIAAVSLAALETAGFFPAMGTAITLTAVTVRAEIKHRATGGEGTHER